MVQTAPATGPHLLQQPVAWHAVSFEDAFWAPRVRLVRERTLPALYQHCLESGRIGALRLAWRPGQHPVPHHFWDSDVAKWLEASSYTLATNSDSWLESRVDEVVALLQSAQQPDGYLNSFVTNVHPEARWTDLRDGHELYCAGHLIEAGVAHYQATGRRTLLDVVCRYADCIDRAFGTQTGKKRGYCGHPEIELALVRLYRATGERRYLDLSSYFVDERGREPYYFDLEAKGRTSPRASDSYYRRHELRGAALRVYNLSHAPVREQTEVVGHAVRAMYLYSAMADLASELGDHELLQACQRLWTHLVSTRVYVTGGIGSSERNEGFSRDYDLPNGTAYAESCAAIGLAFWAHRLLQSTGDSRYADLLETTLYNAIAAAISSDGRQFFYANPLASDGQTHRQPWFQVACCPPNIARLLSSLGQYVYSIGQSHVAVHLFVAGEARLEIGGQPVSIRQEHNYPWDGHIRLELELQLPASFGVWLRLPGWSRGATVHVNGDRLDMTTLLQDGYVRIHRRWQRGDEVRLELPMPVERVYAHPAVADDAGCVAIQRGPIVFCLEEVDNGASLHNVMLPRTAELTTEFDADCLGGITRVSADALVSTADDWDSQLYRRARPPDVQPHLLAAIPYAVWDNRTAGQMRVWLRDAVNA